MRAPDDRRLAALLDLEYVLRGRTAGLELDELASRIDAELDLRAFARRALIRHGRLMSVEPDFASSQTDRVLRLIGLLRRLGSSDETAEAA